jgi:hypothetical protein
MGDALYGTFTNRLRWAANYDDARMGDGVLGKLML